MFVAADDETLIEMRAMRGKKFFTFEGTENEGDTRVHDEGPHEQRAEHERVATARGREQRQDRKSVTEKCAGDVAHKNFCGRPIVTQKTQTAGGDGKRDPKYERVVHVRCEHHPTQRARQRHAARHSVNAIHEVIGVDQTDDPQKRDDDAHHAQMQFTK